MPLDRLAMPRAIGGSRTRYAMQSPRARAATQRNGAAVPPGRPSPAAALGVRTATASCQSSAAACFSRMMPRSVSRCWPPARRPRTSSRTGRHPAPLGSASSGRPGSPSGQSVPQPTQLAYQLRGGGIHHPGVEAHARHHHEGVTTGPADVDRPHSSADRRPQIGRDPKVTNEQVAGPPATPPTDHRCRPAPSHTRAEC